MIGVVAHQGGQVEGGGETGLTLREEIAETLIGVLGGSEAGELTHGPEAPSMHRGVNATRVGRLRRGIRAADPGPNPEDPPACTACEWDEPKL